MQSTQVTFVVCIYGKNPILIDVAYPITSCRKYAIDKNQDSVVRAETMETSHLKRVLSICR